MSACGSPLPSNRRIDPAVAREGERAPRQRQRLLGRGIRRQSVLLGGRRGSRRAAAPRFLARGRLRGMFLGRRRILGARCRQHGECQQSCGCSRTARLSKTNGHVCSSFRLLAIRPVSSDYRTRPCRTAADFRSKLRQSGVIGNRPSSRTIAISPALFPFQGADRIPVRPGGIACKCVRPIEEQRGWPVGPGGARETRGGGIEFAGSPLRQTLGIGWQPTQPAAVSPAPPPPAIRRS